MDLESLKTKFYQLVAPSLPNEWDVEEDRKITRLNSSHT